MRQRINHGVVNPTPMNIGHPNDFFRQFGEQFRVLLSPDPTNRHFLKRVYVRNTPAAEDIRSSLEATSDSCRFLIGPTGIGKSTLVYNEIEVLPSRPSVTAERIVVLIDCEPTAITTSPTALCNYIEPVCNMLEEQMKRTCTEEQVYDFAWGNKPAIVTSVRSSPHQPKSEVMQNLYRTNKRAYVMEWLKLLLSDPECTVTNVLLLLDNVEAIREWEIQTTCVKEILELHECLKNNPGRRYSVNSVIGVRPDSARHLLKDPGINTYAFGTPIVIDTTPPLDEVFRQRFDAVLASVAPKKQPSDKWRNAYTALVSVSKGLSIRDADRNLIARLCNYDLGSTLTTFEQVLSNRVHIQKGYPIHDAGAFEVRRTQFTTEEIPFQKAVIYGNSHRFHDSSDAPVQNVLHNVEDAAYDLLPLLLISFLQHNSEEMGSGDFLYARANVLLDSVDGVLPWSGARKHIEETIDWFRQRALICESPWSTDEDTIIGLTPRTMAIIDLLKANSIALEAFREDLWLNHPAQCLKPTWELSDDQRWRSLIETVMHYQRTENTLLESVINAGATRLYVSLFGNNSMSAILYSGVEHSFYAHFADDTQGKKHDFFNAKDWNRDITQLLEKEFSHE